jgi:hypothetical protein
MTSVDLRRKLNLPRHLSETSEQDNKNEEASRYRRRREHPQENSRKQREQEARPKRPHPRTQRLISARPPCDEITAHDLDGKVKQERRRNVFLAEALFDHFE